VRAGENLTNQFFRGGAFSAQHGAEIDSADEAEEATEEILSLSP